MTTLQPIVDVDFTNGFRENDSIFGLIEVVITSYSLLIPCRQYFASINTLCRKD
jgi:hypothetical protein